MSEGQSCLRVRILFLALDLRPEQDHAECVHVRELVQNFADLGHDVLLLTSRTSTWVADPANPHLAIRHVGGGSTVVELIRVVREMGRFHPHVVYERRFLPKVSAVVSALGAIPALVEINGLVEDEIEMQGRSAEGLLPRVMRHRLHSWAFLQMERIVAVTDRLAGEMSRMYRIPPDRFVVVENGANTRLFRPMDKIECRRRLGLEEGAYWICFEGGLYPWHGVDTLLRAFHVLRGNGIPARLLIVGDGPSLRDLRELSEALGVAGAVHFVGQVPYEEVPLYIGASDVGVGPFTRARNQRIGISPMKVYEYVACGRPVVISGLPGIREWVEREGIGRIVEPDNPDELAAELGGLYRDTLLQEEVAVRGPIAVRRDHSWESIASQLARLCGGLVAS